MKEGSSTRRNARSEKETNSTNLRVHHDLPRLGWEIGIVERPIEGLGRLRLVGRIVVGLKEGVGESIGGGDSSARIEDEHLLEEVDGCSGKEKGEERL